MNWFNTKYEEYLSLLNSEKFNYLPFLTPHSTALAFPQEES